MSHLNIADNCICCGSHQLDSAPAILMPFVAARALGIKPVEITSEWGLRDLKQGTTYMPCHSLQCQSCGVLFLDYRFNDQQMAALYHGYRDADYTQQRDFFEPGYATSTANDYQCRHSYIDDVEMFLTPHLPEQPIVLDWGGGDGLNTPFLGKGQVFIHDISGVTPVDGARLVSNIAPPPDIIICSQVLEHVPSPLELLMEVVPQLATTSLLYLEVPHEQLMRQHSNTQGLALKKHHWHEHINFFTEASLLALTRRAGLRVIDRFNIKYDNGTRQGETLGLLAQRHSMEQQ